MTWTPTERKEYFKDYYKKYKELTAGKETPEEWDWKVKRKRQLKKQDVLAAHLKTIFGDCVDQLV